MERVTFSASYARRTGQEVLYVTQTGGFPFGGKGLSLTEVSPGIEIERDILPHMDFQPVIGQCR
jgi:acyl CoA:acetate/3-ketoacid CoA transferase